MKASSHDKADELLSEHRLELELTTSTASKLEDKPNNGLKGTTLDHSEANICTDSMFLVGIVANKFEKNFFCN